MKVQCHRTQVENDMMCETTRNFGIFYSVCTENEIIQMCYVVRMPREYIINILFDWGMRSEF